MNGGNIHALVVRDVTVSAYIHCISITAEDTAVAKMPIDIYRKILNLEKNIRK
jgi:hypothetical protein